MSVILLISAGVLLLFFGGEMAIWASEQLAQRLRIARRVVGLTLTALLTSLPEIFTNAVAGWEIPDQWPIDTPHNAAGVAVGNVMGSNVANALLIGGIALVYGLSKKRVFRPSSYMALLAPFMTYGLAKDGVLNSFEALILVGIWIMTMRHFSVYAWAERKERKERALSKTPTAVSVLVLLVGGGLMWIGGVYCVNGALLWVEKTSLGAIAAGAILGLGTSLPELAVVVAALRKGSFQVMEGNILGSNVVNPLVALPAVTFGGAVAMPNFLPSTLWAFLATAVFLAGTKASQPLKRILGGLAIVGYFGFLAAGLA
ncbi:hypothetical protein H8D30_05035 [bacterium]|nr:hypothetical protein [bacterium]